jgi:phthiocerol/phenolphthiocerol synthesis type-I polyketide synthase E
LQRLLEERAEGAGPAPSARDEADGDPYDRQLTYDSAATLDAAKSATRQFYNAVSRQLDALEVGAHAHFLNFGYVPDGSPEHARVTLPTRVLNKNCVKLVLEVVGDSDLTDRRVLDIGCGRGGTVSVLRRYHAPRAIVGVDLSPDAIAFCHSVHADSRVRFYEGDAENLMFGDESFDVVTNVESSHSYPNVTAFYSEVFRLLVPGGAFLYTDLFSSSRYRAQIEQLGVLGFAIELERDITPNVLLSCDESATVHRSAFREGTDDALLDDFLGVPGSQVYLEMQNGASTYRILRLRKPAR